MRLWPSLGLLVILTADAFAAGDGFMLGAGVEADNDDGVSAALLGGAGLGEDTWLSGGMAKSSVVLGSGENLDTLYGEIELDHYFDPVGIRLASAYWGENQSLESRDWRASVYWRGDRAMLAGTYTYRDFELTLPATDFFAGRQLRFDADGLGLTFRFDIGKSADLRFSGTSYDYSVNFSPIRDRDVSRLVSASRLSLMNSLDDSRASISLGIDRELKRWEIDVATSRSAVSGARTRSMTLRYLLPASSRTDLELALGHDSADNYDDVLYFSTYLYFYGAN